MHVFLKYPQVAFKLNSELSLEGPMSLVSHLIPRNIAIHALMIPLSIAVNLRR